MGPVDNKQAIVRCAVYLSVLMSPSPFGIRALPEQATDPSTDCRGLFFKLSVAHGPEAMNHWVATAILCCPASNYYLNRRGGGGEEIISELFSGM